MKALTIGSRGLLFPVSLAFGNHANQAKLVDVPNPVPKESELLVKVEWFSAVYLASLTCASNADEVEPYGRPASRLYRYRRLYHWVRFRRYRRASRRCQLPLGPNQDWRQDRRSRTWWEIQRVWKRGRIPCSGKGVVLGCTKWYGTVRGCNLWCGIRDCCIRESGG